LVVGMLWVIANEIPTALREKSFPVPVLTSEVKSLLVLRSQDKLQSPMGQLTTQKIMTGKNTGGRLPLLRIFSSWSCHLPGSVNLQGRGLGLLTGGMGMSQFCSEDTVHGCDVGELQQSVVRG
ncbi:mCG1025614, isoform CRA_a, partial [Mus musculus]